MSDLEAVPNLIIHSCQVLDSGRDVRRIEVKTELVRRGRQMGFSRSRIVDADQPGRVLALTAGEGISIGTPPEGLDRMAVEPIPVIDSPDLPPLWQVFGGHRRSDGHWALPELVAEAASAGRCTAHRTAVRRLGDSGARASRRGGRTDQLQGVASYVMFVARGKAGPFRVEAEPIAGAGGMVAARVVVRDEGVDDRTITVGSYMFRQM